MSMLANILLYVFAALGLFVAYTWAMYRMSTRRPR